MRESGHLVIVLGGVLLVAWYGVTRFTRREREGAVLPSLPAEEAVAAARRALQAELTEAPPSAGPEVACLCCGTPWPAGTLYCECGGETAEADDEWIPPPESAPERLVCVQVVSSSWKASLLKSYLESNEIECVAQSTVSRLEVTMIPAARYASIGLFVPASHEAAARGLLEQAA